MLNQTPSLNNDAIVNLPLFLVKSHLDGPLTLEEITNAEDLEALSESQCGFRPARGTADMFFSERQIQGEVQRTCSIKTFLFAFIDLTKAFDSVHRPTLESTF